MWYYNDIGIEKCFSGEIASTTANFTPSFSRIANFFFLFFWTRDSLCTCSSIWAGCIDWFRNHRPVKQIYRIIVKKNKTALLKRQTHFKLSTAIALNFAITLYRTPGGSSEFKKSQFLQGTVLKIWNDVKEVLFTTKLKIHIQLIP